MLVAAVMTNEKNKHLQGQQLTNCFTLSICHRKVGHQAWVYKKNTTKRMQRPARLQSSNKRCPRYRPPRPKPETYYLQNSELHSNALHHSMSRNENQDGSFSITSTHKVHKALEIKVMYLDKKRIPRKYRQEKILNRSRKITSKVLQKMTIQTKKRLIQLN